MTLVDQKGMSMQVGGAKVDAKIRPMSEDENTSQDWQQLIVKDCENGTYEVQS